MIARIKFGYPAQDVLGKVGATPEGYAALKEIFGTAPEPQHASSGYSWPSDPVIDLETDGPRLIELGIEFVIVKFKGTLPLTAILPNGNHYTVHVQIPHVGLLSVDEVEVIEDACTDKLRTMLDLGWRILAVCPPNAARRPDYVLGRTRDRREAL